MLKSPWKITLHGAIDNATGTVCGLYFDKQETLNGYYHLFERIWLKYGVPAKFLTDNRTVFIYNGLKQKSMEKNSLIYVMCGLREIIQQK